MTEQVPPRDPHSRFEDEGIPDLQNGTPQQQWAVDPQEASLPGDSPAALDDYGTTQEEEIAGESLDGRLSREIPDEQPAYDERAPEDAYGTGGETAYGTEPVDTETGELTREQAAGATAANPEGGLTEDSGLGVGSDLDTDFEPGPDVDEDWEAQPEEPSGTVWDEPRRAGRLVNPAEGAHPDTEADEIAQEVGPDGGGYTAEEAAMRVERE
ncbi:hypothetical protein HNP84_004051 [Thermocatellispora tengchongensis]|uniref:DUF5709 domain-containing protein n=1 Tax=Thermocatellispora tengchongensis TaxID=1073253 RepID=A0A840P5P3_9ACTN|nr:DUF5709 domain-containing protein [Thermocatellispora tengchongensis]MBB5134319.1 hypothetical protein [Thermocatellispora tengchongensis]